MEYNSNVYLTISHEDCEALGLTGTHRTNNAGDTCILEYPTMGEIPTEVQSVLIQTYTHQQILALIEGNEWVSNINI